MPALTTEEFIQRAKTIHGEIYDYSNTIYTGVEKDVEIGCKIHGSFFQMAKTHMRGGGCPICGNKRRILTCKNRGQQKFIDKANKIHNNEYDYSETKYINCSTKVIIICHKHEEIYKFEIVPHDHINGDKRGCPICGEKRGAEKRVKKCADKFVQESKMVHGTKYLYNKVVYKHNAKKVCITCTKDEQGDFWATPNNHLQGSGCPKCKNDYLHALNKKTHEQFLIDAKLVHGELYDYSLVEYVRTNTKVKIICKKHGIFKQEPKVHIGIDKCGCPKCQTSKGEDLIRKFLTENNLMFKEQKRFKDCKNKNPFPFDFYLPMYNLCIEYDGQHHFKPIKYFGGEIAFKKTLLYDQIKNDYCKNNNISLIRIPYTDFYNIENILTNQLNINTSTSEHSNII
jgi:hypothetical protein